MAGFQMSVNNAETIIDSLDDRNNRIGGTAGGGEYPLLVGDQAVVDAGDDIGDIALARGGQNNLCDAGSLQMPSESFTVTPLAGIIDQNRIVDTVPGVIDIFRCIGVDDPDHVAVGDDRILFFINRNNAVKRAMNRIAAKQAGPLQQVIRPPLANDGRPDPQFFTAA